MTKTKHLTSIISKLAILNNKFNNPIVKQNTLEAQKIIANFKTSSITAKIFLPIILNTASNQEHRINLMEIGAESLLKKIALELSIIVASHNFNTIDNGLKEILPKSDLISDFKAIGGLRKYLLIGIASDSQSQASEAASVIKDVVDDFLSKRYEKLNFDNSLCTPPPTQIKFKTFKPNNYKIKDRI